MKARNAQGKLQKTLTGGVPIALAGASLIALGSGALWWPAKSMLCVSDLHLGKSERYARAGGATLPPYQTQGTLLKLESDLDAYPASTVICLGDSFDHPQAPSELAKDDRLWINRLQAGRDWIWIEGN
ncbi:MAG: metallophosphoesterase, partial [Rhodobacteraceae bacterium]|nr:metallophosphoesterase [Paracoccaceae bacterium]